MTGTPAGNGAHGGDTPLVSVVTPCHNAAAFVGETIASVAAQTYPRVEHVVVDDASTDGSWAVIEQYGTALTAIRLVRHRGGCHARNRGAAAARGEFLMFLDADDAIAPDTVEALVAAAQGQPRTIAVCACKRWTRRPDGTWVEAPRERPVPEPDADLFEAFLTMSAWPPSCSVLWRRDAYDLTEGWDEELARDQDTDILLRAYARGVRLVRARGGTGYYRSADSTRASVSGGISLARYRASVRVLDKLSAELERLGLHPAYAELLSQAYHKRALYGFRVGFWDAARESLRKGEALGRHVASTTAGARVLERLLGMERKERVVQYLAGLGVSTESRRALADRKRTAGVDNQPLVHR